MSEQVKDPSLTTNKLAWNPDNSGFGKHSYRHIDPATVNPEDYARSMRGEEQHYGEVREYNTGDNEKHPKTDLDLYDLGLIGTKFKTNAEGLEGDWEVSDLFRVQAPKVWIRATRLVDGIKTGDQVEILAETLGVATDENNLYKQVESTLVKRGLIDREQRKALATGMKTRLRMQEGQKP